jgi:hypothetical protein
MCAMGNITSLQTETYSNEQVLCKTNETSENAVLFLKSRGCRHQQLVVNHLVSFFLSWRWMEVCEEVTLVLVLCLHLLSNFCVKLKALTSELGGLG